MRELQDQKGEWNLCLNVCLVSLPRYISSSLPPLSIPLCRHKTMRQLTLSSSDALALRPMDPANDATTPIQNVRGSNANAHDADQDGACHRAQ